MLTFNKPNKNVKKLNLLSLCIPPLQYSSYVQRHSFQLARQINNIKK